MTFGIYTKIAGIFSYPEGKGILKTLPTGQAMILKREPENPHDQNAIAVYANSVDHPPIKLGYVQKVIAAQLKEAEILGVYKGIGWDEIRIDVAEKIG